MQPNLNTLARPLEPGERVGPYRLVHQLGAGGMAQVWLALRADGAFKRMVALKLPDPGRWRPDLATRFARECDILATLEHPSIVRLYDAGATPEGRHYLAMEYVAGEPLIAWCDGRRLSVRARLTLFLRVLEAVQYAHRRGVIHRDIKPSNILVTDEGEVRLLDFGAAKQLEPDGLQTDLTQVYGQALTPEYASPELLRGDPVSATADVYALGVVLYELLSGSRPCQVMAEARMRWRQRALPRRFLQEPSGRLAAEAGASRGTTQGRLAWRLRGDLDAIIQKALATQPQQRYGSARELADDLRRYLNSEPVQARPDRMRYRLAKFALRHRKALTLLAAVSALAMAAVGYALTRPYVAAPIEAPADGSVVWS